MDGWGLAFENESRTNTRPKEETVGSRKGGWYVLRRQVCQSHSVKWQSYGISTFWKRRDLLNQKNQSIGKCGKVIRVAMKTSCIIQITHCQNVYFAWPVMLPLLWVMYATKKWYFWRSSVGCAIAVPWQIAVPFLYDSPFWIPIKQPHKTCSQSPLSPHFVFPYSKHWN